MLFHSARTCLVVGRCHASFRHVPRRYSSTESHSSSNTTVFAAAMICSAASVMVAVTAADNQNNNITHMQGRFSFFEPSPKKNKTLLQHPNVTVWSKGGRTIYLLGARNYSTESATLATQLVETIQPQAVFIDIDEHVFVSFGMYDEVIKVLEQANVSTNNLNFDFQGDVQGVLPAVPKDDDGNDSDGTSFLESLLGGSNNAVETAIQTMFAKLKYAGIDETQPMASSGQQFVNAFVEGHKNGATLVLGGRTYEITKARSDEAMAHTPASAATIPLDLKWRPDETDRENYRRFRNEMQRVVSIFFQVVGMELDEHIATKLNKLHMYPNIVAIVMMLHVDGVEESLQKMGWKEQG